MKRHAALFAIALGLLVLGVEAKHSEGMVVVNKWMFVERFAAKESNATFYFSMQSTSGGNDSDVAISIYIDTDTSWPVVYANRDVWKCEDLVYYSLRTIRASQMPKKLNVWAVRDRWWYMAISACGSDAGTAVYYNFTFLNDNGVGRWRHFSADEEGILEETIGYFAALSLLALWTGYCWLALKFLKLQFAITKRLCISILLEFFAALFCLIHWSRYANDGVGVVVLKQIASFLSMCSEMLFLLLLVFLAKGYKVSGRHLTHKRFMMLLWIPFPILYFALYLYSILGVDPASVIYVYESAPGYCIVALHLVALVFFAITTLRTRHLDKDVSHRRFYVLFLLYYGAFWFLSVPVVVLIAHFLGPWYREKVVVGVQYCIKLICFLFLSLVFSAPPIRSKFVQKLKHDAFDNAMQIFPGME